MSLKAILEHLKKDFTLKGKEVFYKVGDRFECKCGIYRINSLGNNRVALIIVKKYYGDEVGTVWTAEDYSVKDPSRITQKEFDRISERDQNYPAWFTLIKEEEPEEKDEDEIYYKVGDRFNGTPGIYQLSHTGNNRIGLIVVEKVGELEIGWTWRSEGYKVNNIHHITQEEFYNVTGGHPEWFTLIKEDGEEGFHYWGTLPREEEVFYKAGDRFKYQSGIYRIETVGTDEDIKAMLVKVENPDGSKVWRVWMVEDHSVKDHSVKDPEHITQEEFSRISDGIINY